MSNFLDFPLVALRGVVVFPKGIMSFEIGRQKSVSALEKSIENGSLIFAVTQKESSKADPLQEDLYTRGTIIRITQVKHLPNNAIKVIAEGVDRADILEYTQTNPFFKVSVNIVPAEEMEPMPDVEIAIEALIRESKRLFEKYARYSNKIPPDAVLSILSADDIGTLSDLIAIHSPLDFKQKQRLLEIDDLLDRLDVAMEILASEIDILLLQTDIAKKVKKRVDKTQRDYYLREQLKVINEELGTEDGIAGEVKEYRDKIKSIELPQKVAERLEKELNRLSKISITSGESTVSRDYIEWLIDLPWIKVSEENIDLSKCEDILNEDHYALSEVKERIIEYLAVRQKTSNANAPILCLSGPPGVGKTSIAKSMAKALNREYVRISLGGVRDEAEIRGHRRTYIGSMPGRIIDAIKQSGVKNPLILLDEIDKITSDFKGDPSSALLEVLDSEQNKSFRDHYIELEFDLSDVIFVCTANSMHTVQKALADRMEVIQLHSYTKEEKLNIAKEFLLRKQLGNHELKGTNLQLADGVLETIIQSYTKEAGVRQLERLIGKLCRKAVKIMMLQKKRRIKVTLDNLHEFLGAKRYKQDTRNEIPDIGIVRGLAWTAVGGSTLSVEVNIMKGTGKLELTGNMGDVMKESAKAGISYIRSETEKLGLTPTFYKNTDLHIHIPEGAIPKDGPSAGITMTTAMVSALTKIPVRNDVAMTGEITIRGNVLQIGGLKEKALAAKNAGIKKIIIPEENRGDLEELQDYVKSDLEFICVSHIGEVLEIALLKEGNK